MLNVRIRIPRVNARIKAKCEKHPLYNPVKTGQGGIKANCQGCYQVLEIYQDYTRTLNAHSDLDARIDQHGVRYGRKNKEKKDGA